jgi:PGF-CTERM protein
MADVCGMRQRIQALVLSAVVVASLFAVTPATAATGTDSVSNHASVTFDAQTTGGHTVTVDSVTLEDGGFVTVHDDSLGDGETLGSVVGSSAYLEEGTHENVTVRLESPVSEDATLTAMPHRDTDGDRVYEFVSGNGEVDGPYTADGGAVVDSANVTVSATVTASDQPTDGESVVLDRVELSEPGFVAVHDSSLLDGAVLDSVVGHSEYLAAGVHEDVRVTLDESVGNETLLPMPHRDTDGDQTYTFVESEGSADGPFTDAEGNAVVDTVAVTAESEANATLDAQATGGHSVVVDEVFVPDGGFVTIHDASVTEGAVFDSVRGTSAYLEPGLHREVTVTLDAPLNESGTLVAMPHRDTDGDQTYTFVESEGSADGPYTAGGEAVVDTGDATVAAALDYETQESDGHTITVDRVDLSEPGFVAVHDPSLGTGDALGSVLGVSDRLAAGVHEDVTVTLDTPANETQVLTPMAHVDSNDDGNYTFVESEGAEDGPFTADGGAVVDSATTLVTASVTASDQSTDGATVTVDSVTLADGGFVTIHDASVTEGAVFDSVRGTSAYLAPGTHENVTVTLADELDADATLVPMAHRDTDGDQTYTFVESEGSEDGPYTAGGEPVVTTAAADAPESASLTFGDQTTAGSSVTVDSVTWNEGGYVVIHASDDGEPGEVLGYSAYRGPGTHEDITIQLSTDIDAETELVAMAHLDTDGDQTYEFPDADGPYVMDGSAVVDAATISPASMGDDGGNSMGDETTMGDDDSMNDGNDGEDGGSVPGFGVAAALAAVLAAALLVLRE